jgi:hypothetical protein
MSEIMNKSDIPSTSSLTKFGVTAVGYTITGVLLLVLNALANYNVFAFAIGGLILLFGIGFIRSKEPADKKAGIILTAVGLLTVVSKMGIPAISGLSGVILVVATVGLLALGVWNGIKFFIGLKKRS